MYASSSSVYGPKQPVPFFPDSPKALLGNMYATSKMAGENLVTYYCSTYKFSAIGLRFFTVYGPWGRPDMAVFAFARNILNKKSIPVYYSK